MKEILERVREASVNLALLSDDRINDILNQVADEAIIKSDMILAANREDLSRMNHENPMYDRLKLTAERIEGIAADIRKVATLSSPLGIVQRHTVLPNGLDLKRVTVPFGVIGIVYEARPNVTFDVFALCMKSGNACVLKGGKDADVSNRAIVTIIRDILLKNDINPHVIELLPATHESTAEMLHANGLIDLVIPRGSSRLIDFVRNEATVPVIETGAGVCHAYFDKDGDVEKAAMIINNAKTRRVSVCNALDCVIVHEDRVADIPAICKLLKLCNVKIYADEQAMEALTGNYPQELLYDATNESYGTEFQSYAMALKVVTNVNDALKHISQFGSGHSECIITENETTADLFMRMVDAACVYCNAPTSFTDGAQFGLGAEIGISTQKLHARGPMALEEMTTYKWLIHGNAQIRQ